MGVYRFPKLLTSKSEPAILGVVPGRVWLTGQEGVFFDAPAAQIEAKANTKVGHITLTVEGTKHIVAGVGSAKGGPFSQAQIQELQASRQAISTDPTPSVADLVGECSRVIGSGSRTSPQDPTAPKKPPTTSSAATRISATSVIR